MTTHNEIRKKKAGEILYSSYCQQMSQKKKKTNSALVCLTILYDFPILFVALSLKPIGTY